MGREVRRGGREGRKGGREGGKVGREVRRGGREGRRGGREGMRGGREREELTCLNIGVRDLLLWWTLSTAGCWSRGKWG